MLSFIYLFIFILVSKFFKNIKETEATESQIQQSKSYAPIKQLKK